MRSTPVPARVLVVAGTHGNERNAPWLLDHWSQQPGALASCGLELELVVGNPAAYAQNRRYLERDLNRCFAPALLADPALAGPDLQRARELVARHGPEADVPCLVALDLHSTTSAMGNSLVIYGRRPTDLALAAGLQARLGLPIYLHEADTVQTGFLVERWPCGLVIEVGPVPQGVITAQICRQTQLAVEAALAVLAAAQTGDLRLPPQLLVHRHLCSLDLPRRPDGSPAACLHPALQHRDWWPLQPGDPVFSGPGGEPIGFVPPPGLEDQPAWPVFVNEAAYGEKGIALSLTRRESWPVLPEWQQALTDLASQLAQRGAPL
ncbi:aspartoacylase [Cyanobium sp. T1B-Tous]|uniref:aspartoacylase n=1 Tax=Cyanobium sp. T1B-Tous TaxID=2823721 RepID=UPI0020CF943B|nr:aspartoacylase [Cyanobium sp. T1B-Tous]MCP9805449.1 aspartoacylase [Cyanobium sp. T1B-Tous]